MKLSNLISNGYQSSASVLLARSLFGFHFLHHATGAKRNHRVNLKTIAVSGITTANALRATPMAVSKSG